MNNIKTMWRIVPTLPLRTPNEIMCIEALAQVWSAQKEIFRKQSRKTPGSGLDTWVQIPTVLFTGHMSFSKLFIPVRTGLCIQRDSQDMVEVANGNHYYYYAKARHYYNHYNDFFRIIFSLRMSHVAFLQPS